MTEFTEGDYVTVPDGGQGVVVSVMDESFEFPTESGEDPETTEIDASSGNPTYVVALMQGGLATAKEDEIDGISGLSGKGADVESPDDAVGSVTDAELSEEELVNIPGVDDPHVGFNRFPDGWTRKSVLQGWANLGGTWRSAYAKMLTAFGPRKAKRMASAWKDESLQTESWRGKF
jgi:hypothetical protein